MAFQKFRSPSIFIGGKKMGTIVNHTYKYTSGDEPQFGDPGLLGYSDGAAITGLSCSAVVPVKGMETDLVQRMQNKEDFDIAVGILNGKIHQVTMRCTNAEFKGDQKAGTLTGDFEFGGGEPAISA